MGKKSKRGSGPRPGSNRAERVAARKARQIAALAPTPRPFVGLAAECDLVALRTFVASATARVELIEPGPPPRELTSVVATDDAPAPRELPPGVRNEVFFGTVLPGAVAALVRENRGEPEGFVGLQTEPDRIDLDGELAEALAWAAHAAPGDEFTGAEEATDLSGVLKADAALEIIVYDDFSWWFPPGTEVPAEIAEMFARANDSVMPTARLAPKSGIGAPWWVDAGEKAHLRWIRPENEDDLMNAMARLHAAGHLTLGEGSRFAGSFRTHGLLVPVFDLDNEMHHEEWYEGVNEFDTRLTDALADDKPLTIDELSSRDGIRGRQVTLR